MAYAIWQNDDTEDLLEALRSGNVEELCSILDQSDSACTDYQACRLLTEVCSSKSKDKINIHLLECLLRHGFSPNSKDTSLYRDTPLHSAAMKGDVDAVDLLLRYNADVTATNCFGQTPLHHACTAGAKEVAALLLSAGADVDSKDCDQCTPLIHAVAADQTPMLKLLIQNGADVDAVNDELLSALDHALLYNRGAMISLLLKAGAHIDHKQEGCIYYLGHYCNSILYSLLAHNDSENISLLFDLGYTFRDDTMLLNLGTPGAKLNLDPQMIASIKCRIGQPRSLFGMCRVVIRNTVNSVRNNAGPSLEARLDSLALPAKLRNYLALREHEE